MDQRPPSSENGERESEGSVEDEEEDRPEGDPMKNKVGLQYRKETTFGVHPPGAPIKVLTHSEIDEGAIIAESTTTKIQVQFTAAITTPCCDRPITLARCFEFPKDGKKPQITYPITWSGIACPRCQATFTFEIDYEQEEPKDPQDQRPAYQRPCPYDFTP